MGESQVELEEFKIYKTKIAVSSRLGRIDLIGLEIMLESLLVVMFDVVDTTEVVVGDGADRVLGKSSGPEYF